MLLPAVLWIMAGAKANAQGALDRLTIEDGVCQIGTVEDFANFAEAVEDGSTDLNALLTADIDLTTSVIPNLMIGSESAQYAGIFDGGGHTVTYNYDVTDNYNGLFRYIDGATVRNLRIKGDAVVTSIHFGALVGWSNGEVLVENVVTDVNIVGARSGVTGDGGMVGRLEGPITFNNCATLGEMGNPGSSMYCGFVAYAGNGSSVLNNCFTACTLTEGTGLDYCFTFCRGTAVLNNCYFVNQIGAEKVEGKQVTVEQVRTGSLCFKLNGDQSEILWTQTIGTDPVPMPGTGSLRVYATGTLRCDGTEMEDNPLSYSNTESYPVIPDHQFGDDGLCIVCGTPDPDAVKKNAEGFYLIGSPKQLKWLAQKIEQGDEMAKVLLTDDIDLTLEDEYLDLMLASEEHRFQGIFDGGGHTITYDYGYVQEKWRGFFRAVGDGAVIRNLRIEGDVIPTNIHYGALIGVAYGTVLVENVVTNVHITGDHSGVTGDAGMLGANYADITFNNCATLGEMGCEGSSMYSPFSGWSHGDSKTTLNNCFSTCKLTEGTSSSNCFTLTHQSGTVTINNSYYLYVLGNVLTGERIHQSQITEEQIESGELCFLLNGDQTEIGWYQTLGEDELPVPDASHLRVYGAGKFFVNITDEASFRNYVSDLISEEKERYEEIIAQKSLIETYLSDLEALSQAADIEAFMASYNALASQRQSIQSCADAYAAYIVKVDEVKQYLIDNPSLTNEKAALLKSYLYDVNEPSEDYPNGSFEYIIEQLELSEEEITAEAAFVEAKLTEAITSTPAVGTDVSLLFVNIDLKDKFEGWEGTLPTGWGGSATSPLYAAECLGATMDMHQTVTGLPNGIYELQVNGAFRPTPYDDYYNVNYAATLYANGTHNFFQTNIEDMIDVEDAIDGENCNITGPVSDFAITDENGDVIGYTMQGIVSCCNAFQAGRYPNSVLCEVKDGTLTIGIRQPGTGLTRDWLGFGNIKVFYYGQVSEANESLDRVLASQADRATTILYTYEPDFTTEYNIYPNFSQALKDELQQTLNAVASANTPEAKFQLIEKFSSLFQQIYECKQAYITLMDKAEEVNALLDAFKDILTDEEYIQMDDLWSLLADGYEQGTLSAEEALAIDINSVITFLPDSEDDYYLLRYPKDFFVFASLVNAGKTQINAKLLEDINLSETEEFSNIMVGTEETEFAGTFDGQGHTVTYYYADINDKWRGLFAFVNGATIRNLRVEGEAYPAAIHFGALIGRAYGTVLVENVVTDVHITGQIAGITGDGGMLGANYANITFNNCATLGEMGNEGSSMYSSYSGWSNGDSYTTLNNCYTACTLTPGTGVEHSFTLSHGSGKNTFNNCYYLNVRGTAQGKQMTLTQFQSGEVCYKLNGDQSVINWYQTICDDKYPVPFATREVVLYNSEYGFYNDTVDGPVGIVSPLGKTKDEGAVIYNIAGQRISKMQKGINIVNGKKIIVK